MAKLSALFFDTRKPVVNRSVCVVEADWILLDKCFPEAGFRSYFSAFIVSTLANELRKKGITDFHARFRHPDSASLERVLSNIRTAIEVAFRDVGPGTRSVHTGGSPDDGVAPNITQSGHPQVKGSGETEEVQGKG
jgi:hypothetical protein